MVPVGGSQLSPGGEQLSRPHSEVPGGFNMEKIQVEPLSLFFWRETPQERRLLWTLFRL